MMRKLDKDEKAAALESLRRMQEAVEAERVKAFFILGLVDCIDEDCTDNPHLTVGWALPNEVSSEVTMALGSGMLNIARAKFCSKVEENMQQRQAEKLLALLQANELEEAGELN